MLLAINSVSLGQNGELVRSPYAKLISQTADKGELREALRYNELKAAILDLLATEGWCDSNRIIERARSESRLSGSPRSVRMALLRYHRYGLIHREWRRGEYVYKLSDRGAKRLEWLKASSIAHSRSM